MPELASAFVLESHNPYPDCLELKLTATTNTEQCHVQATIQFNEQWESLLGGRVKFGLKGGELSLKLENGEFVSLVSSFDGSFYQAINGDSQANPVWIFQVKPGELVLKGRLETIELASFNPSGKPARVEATFAVSKHQVYLTDAEGLWRHDISPNQHAVIDRALVSCLLETKFKPYVSWAQLCYECLPTARENIAETPPVSESIQTLIQQISDAKTDNFIELAKIALVDPMIDFAGGNLRGTTLSKVEMCGANLARANLRGADLTDADLSDANLSGAKLGGADLSGAYLEKADLSDADLHRASLALVNLGGANLSGANLIEANLTSTNLGGAEVKGAKFGNNSGLTAEAKLNLRERGAIFHRDR